ncbi:Endothelin-converting enzyme 1 [Venturia nashicola]|uniref:Endothelin-converting enzyme 1 n=1 Tax=Venturia nashicola TaxID=86259 RepID=A0A4Z1P1R0_9PEZI|nr:Endothelin-converting enzyme 1 [Venturia nashicola]
MGNSTGRNMSRHDRRDASQAQSRRISASQHPHPHQHHHNHNHNQYNSHRPIHPSPLQNPTTVQDDTSDSDRPPFNKPKKAVPELEAFWADTREGKAHIPELLQVAYSNHNRGQEDHRSTFRPIDLLEIFHKLRAELGTENEQTVHDFRKKYITYREGAFGTLFQRIVDVQADWTRDQQVWDAMGIAVVQTFLQGISGFIQTQKEGATQQEKEDGPKRLAEWLIIEPPFPPQYSELIAELKSSFPKGNEEELDKLCTRLLPEAREGIGGNSTWIPFIKFMVQYFIFLRDVDPSNLLKTYDQLSQLVQKASSAFKDAILGHMLLGSMRLYCKLLARLAIGLDKQPELIAGLAEESVEEDAVPVTLPERAANTVREALAATLQDKSDGMSGKRGGIYIFANLCLKILFQCKKIRNCSHTFNSIDALSPPLRMYPKPQQVTYLYYLGRFHFSTSHFFRAQLALQHAYDLCPPFERYRKQRRLILIYLLTSNMILGRMPAEVLWDRPESRGLRERFDPICTVIKKGDLATFRWLTSFDNEHASWFLHFRIFLQIRNRCEVLVIRTLARKVFALNGDPGDLKVSKSPNLQISDLVHILRYLERKALNPVLASDIPGRSHFNMMFVRDTIPKAAYYMDPDFEGAEDLPEEEDDERVLVTDDRLILPDMFEVESIVASLINQGLLNAFIAQKMKRIAIKDMKKANGRSVLDVGFPNVWEVVKRNNGNAEVPGWKVKEGRAGGQTYNLGAVKEIGA